MTTKNVNTPKFHLKAFTQSFQEYEVDYKEFYQCFQNTKYTIANWPMPKSGKKQGKIEHFVQLFGNDPDLAQKGYLNRRTMRKILKSKEDELTLKNKKIQKGKSIRSYMLNLKVLALRLSHSKLI